MSLQDELVSDCWNGCWFITYHFEASIHNLIDVNGHTLQLAYNPYNCMVHNFRSPKINWRIWPLITVLRGCYIQANFRRPLVGCLLSCRSLPKVYHHYFSLETNQTRLMPTTKKTLKLGKMLDEQQKAKKNHTNGCKVFAESNNLPHALVMDVLSRLSSVETAGMFDCFKE